MKSTGRIVSKHMRWYQWLVVLASVLLTLGAWKMSSSQQHQKTQLQFEFQVQQLLVSVTERMLHYEVALKAGSAAKQSLKQNMGYQEWQQFANSLKLEQTYPGINGIGVIYHVQPENIDQFVARQRIQRPDFDIRPQSPRAEYWPVTLVEPFAANAKAIGLDMAFESNRLTAAQQARDTGTTQITAPIVLVQDAEKTPGFLKYVPFYQHTDVNTLEARQQHFIGHVYAPFIMNDFIEAIINHKERLLVFNVTDSGTELYNEITVQNEHVDSDPMFKKDVTLDMYGRLWRFHIQTSNTFRQENQSNQPIVILTSGILINMLLFFLFLTLSRSRDQAVVLAQEITSQLSIKEAYFRNITEAAPCGIIIINAKGEIEKVNVQTELLFGYSERELLGKNVDFLVPVRFQHEHHKYRQTFMNNPSHRRMGLGREIFGLTKTGHEFPAEIGLAQIKAEGGLKTLATVIDMTEHERVTGELKRSNKDLSDFAYVASHDLKAPLRGIMQLASWIEEDIIELADDETKKHLTLLMSRTSRLENLLEDLLAYSRIGRKVGESRIIDTRVVFVSLFELLDPPEDMKLICPNDMPQFNTMVSPFETVVRNLLGNAIKHQDKSNGTITISAEETPHFYQFSVQDDGPGIKPEHHEQIFQLFKTLKPRDEVEGSGMGLSIIQKLLDYQGGSIKVESDGINGTCFTFTWPK